MIEDKKKECKFKHIPACPSADCYVLTRLDGKCDILQNRVTFRSSYSESVIWNPHIDPGWDTYS